ncbi:hypothetical protein [Dehalobacterium formicoaceticum]|uniref:hypothetical protein n=1 Tax=Dehalobacterium formicoaceticum TaxID=51515 RepID=UPI000B7D30B7|nr:hypothetical protein [Dehalobacterium formicoaceticum]
MARGDRYQRTIAKLHLDRHTIEQWEFKIFDGSFQRGVIKLETEVGAKCLQIRRAFPDQIFHYYLLMEHLAHQGFKNIPRLIRTKFGAPYLEAAGNFYCVSDWISGNPVNFRDDQDVLQTAQGLGKLHLASRGFYFTGEKWEQTDANPWAADFLRTASQIVRLKGQIKKPLFFKESLERMADQAVTAAKFFTGPEYKFLKEQVAQDLSICHSALTQEHLIMGWSQEVSFTGLMHWKRDLPLRDLIDFLFIVGRENQWDETLCQKVVTQYDQILHLEPRELRLLRGIMMFPRGYWELLHEMAGQNSKGKDAKKRLEDFWSQEEKKEGFLSCLFA